MAKFRESFQRVEYIVSRINNKLGKTISFLLIVIMLTTLFEIIARYFFNRPTIWVWGVNTQMFALIIFLGGGYHLLHRQVIVADILYERFSEKGKRIADIISFIIFLIFYGVLLWKGTSMAYKSIMQREYSQGFFSIPLYPIKAFLPIGTFLIIIQWGVMFIRNLIGSDKGEMKNEH